MTTLINGSLGGAGGSNRQAFIIANVFKVVNATSTAAEVSVWTPAAGKKFRLMGFCLGMTGATGALLMRDNTTGTIINIVQLANGGSGISVLLGSNGILSAAANNPLTFTGPASSVCNGVVFGTEE